MSHVLEKEVKPIVSKCVNNCQRFIVFHPFLQVKQHQSEIFQFLDSKKIKYRTLDITSSTDVKEEMRKKVGNPSAMPPQVFNGDKYCGVSLIVLSCF